VEHTQEYCRFRHMVQIQIKFRIAFGYVDSQISSFTGPDSIEYKAFNYDIES
jgi:hypothetical protein